MRPTVRLVPMTEAEFAAWGPASVRGYAAQQVAAGLAREPRATANAWRAWRRLLPLGLATPGHHFWRVHDPGGPVGHLWLAIRGEEAYLYDVVLAPGARGRGLGRAAMHAVEQAAVERGATVLRLNVFGHNEPALGLYRSLGYVVVDTSRTAPHQGSRLVAALMEKRLG